MTPPKKDEKPVRLYPGGTTNHPIRLTNAALDWVDGRYAIRGVIDPASLEALKLDEYQREVLPPSSKADFIPAIKSGGVPDIYLGMRGERFSEQGDGVILLHDDVYIVDGLQRKTAALDILHGGDTPHLGATIVLNTDEPWERQKFHDLNTSQRPLKANVLVRNERKTNHFIAMLYDLCLDSDFCLYQRVGWNQNLRRSELMSAPTYLGIVAQVHARFKSGLTHNDWRVLAKNMLTLTNRLGRNMVRNNIKTYWNALDEMFNVKGVVYRSSAPYLRLNFNMVLARVYGKHKDFWKDDELKIPSDLKRKLATFDLKEPTIAGLCSGSTKVRGYLFNLLVEHINSGKRTRRLTPFVAEGAEPEQAETENEPDTSFLPPFRKSAPSSFRLPRA